MKKTHNDSLGSVELDFCPLGVIVTQYSMLFRVRIFRLCLKICIDMTAEEPNVKLIYLRINVDTQYFVV